MLLVLEEALQCGEASFSAFDCTMVYARQKEDPWNSIMAGADTSGFLSMRQGLGAAGRSAIFGGVLLVLIEGAGIMLNRVFSAQQNFPPMDDPNLAAMMASGGSGLPLDFLPAGHLPPGAASGTIPSAVLAVDASSFSASSSWFGGLFGGGNKSDESKNNGLGVLIRRARLYRRSIISRAVLRG